MKGTVAIIGAVGTMGSPMALGLAVAGYRVLLTDDIRNHPFRYLKLSWLEHKISWKVPQSDVEMAVSRREASWEADIIILAVPDAEQAEVASRIDDVVTGKIIVSLEVPLNGTHEGSVTDPTIGVAEELVRLFPHSKIVKVVSVLFADHPENQKVGGRNTDVFVTGDDEKAVATVIKLVRDAGFHPVIAGTPTMRQNPEDVIAEGEEHAIYY